MQMHILVVDDNAGVRAVIGELLTEAGYRVTLAQGGSEMRSVLSDDPSVDAIILDLFLTDEAGESLALYAETLKVSTILITGGSTGREFARAHHIQLLRKPFKSDQLFAAVARAVDPRAST